MTNTQLVSIRAEEEIAEQGTIGAAIDRVKRQILAPESTSSERSFMRKVLANLLDRIGE
jgi:hypothetical protein